MFGRNNVQADERQYIHAEDDVTCSCGTAYRYSMFRGFYCPKCGKRKESHHSIGKRGRRDNDGRWK